MITVKVKLPAQFGDKRSKIKTYTGVDGMEVFHGSLWIFSDTRVDEVIAIHAKGEWVSLEVEERD